MNVYIIIIIIWHCFSILHVYGDMIVSNFEKLCEKQKTEESYKAKTQFFHVL